MRERVVITGISCISPFGIGPSRLYDALAAGQCGVAPIATFDTTDCRSHAAAAVTGFDPVTFIPPMKLRRMDAVSRLALSCAKLLAEDGVTAMDGDGADATGVALGTWTAGLDSLTEYLDALVAHGPMGVPAILFSSTISNAPASLCAIEFGLHGPNVTFNQREVSSLAAIAFSVGAVRSGRTAAMVTGGADCLEETFFKVYDRFRVLSPTRAADDDMHDAVESARPFDRRRNGFVLGEGAYLLLVESASVAASRGAREYGEILGVGATSSPAALNAWPADSAGVARAMRLALEDAALSCDDVSAVIAAANGAPELDRTEADAIRDVFAERAVPVCSIKGAIGECGAAGAAAIIAILMSASKGCLPPTAGFAESDPACPVAVTGHPRPMKGQVLLINGVAAGGTHYCLAIRIGPS